MGLKIIENNYEKYVSKFNTYLKNNLDLTKNIVVEMSKYGFRDRNTLKIYFKENSIYWGNLKKNNKNIYFFGLGSKHLKNKGMKRIDPPIAVYLDDQFRGSGIVFGKKNKDVFILMRIDYSYVLDVEKSVLFEKNEIIVHDGKSYINLGSLSEGCEILENLRRFIHSCQFDKKHHKYIRINSIKIPNGFNSLDGHDFVDSCELCGMEILETYDNNPKITECVGFNSKICLNCYSKILVAYFQSKIADYSNKSYLLSSVKNEKLINFYINLAEITGIIDRGHEIIFKEDLKSYKKYFHIIPDDLYIEDIPVGLKGINGIINKIDEITLDYNDLSKDFKLRLFENDLSDKVGWEIRTKLIMFAKNNDLNNTKKNINYCIDKLISDESDNHKQYNILNLAKKLKELTLGYGSNLNEGFINKLKSNGINPEEGYDIRSQIVYEIENKIITEADQIEIRLNELIYEYGHQQCIDNNNESNILKEYLLMSNSLIIKSILPKYDLNDFIEMLNYMRDNSLSLNSLIILELDETFSKVFVELNVHGSDFRFKEILDYNNYKNLNLKGD